MEKITVSKEEYEKMRLELIWLKSLERIDLDLVKQFKDSLEDLKAGRIKRVA